MLHSSSRHTTNDATAKTLRTSQCTVALHSLPCDARCSRAGGPRRVAGSSQQESRDGVESLTHDVDLDRTAVQRRGMMRKCKCVQAQAATVNTTHITIRTTSANHLQAKVLRILVQQPACDTSYRRITTTLRASPTPPLGVSSVESSAAAIATPSGGRPAATNDAVARRDVEGTPRHSSAASPSQASVQLTPSQASVQLRDGAAAVDPATRGLGPLGLQREEGVLAGPVAARRAALAAVAVGQPPHQRGRGSAEAA